MPLSTYISVLLYVLVFGITPGPANIFAFSCSVKYGWTRTMRMWLGMLVGFMIDWLVILLICYFLEESFAQYVSIIKYAGAAIILWLAINLIRTSGLEKDVKNSCTFLSGLLVQLTNAKMIIFEITIYSLFVIPESRKFIDFLCIGLLLPLAGPACNLLWIALGGFARNVLHKYEKIVDVVMAIALIACAVMLVLPKY